MIWWRRSPTETTIDGLYGTIVAQARLPVFYTVCGVADTVEGRFEMLVLHLALVARRLARDPASKPLANVLFARFCRDLDHNLREMGVGDLTVPKKMQSFAEAYFGRSRAYDLALAAGDHEARAAAVARNVFGLSAPSVGAHQIAHYMERAAEALDMLPASEFSQAGLRFPDPVMVPAATAVA
jgi:cytochrome b pre-mRNA-processing protein 3